MSIHDKIRTLRTAKGLTQENMAIELKIDSVNYGRIERGQAKITVERLEKIAEFLGVRMVDFFIDEENATRNGMLDPSILTKIYEEIKIIREHISK